MSSVGSESHHPIHPCRVRQLAGGCTFLHGSRTTRGKHSTTEGSKHGITEGNAQTVPFSAATGKKEAEGREGAEALETQCLPIFSVWKSCRLQMCPPHCLGRSLPEAYGIRTHQSQGHRSSPASLLWLQVPPAQRRVAGLPGQVHIVLFWSTPGSVWYNQDSYWRTDQWQKKFMRMISIIILVITYHFYLIQ